MKCPNCQSENIEEQKDGKLLCIACDTSFKIEKDGAKVVQTDVIDNLDKRVSAVEKKISAQPPQPDQPAQPINEDPDDQGPDAESDDNLFAK